MPFLAVSAGLLAAVFPLLEERVAAESVSLLRTTTNTQTKRVDQWTQQQTDVSFKERRGEKELKDE